LGTLPPATIGTLKSTFNGHGIGLRLLDCGTGATHIGENDRLMAGQMA
jgi:hypothetical protein